MTDGKEIILQRLRKTSKLSKYRKLDHETSDIFDFCAKKYDVYRKSFDDNKLIFHVIKKSDVNKSNISNLKGEQYEKLLKIPKNLKSKGKFSKEIIDKYVNRYDERTNRFYDKLCFFKEKQNDFMNDKNINPIFMVNWMIGGKLNNGEIFYAPFAFQEVKININHRNREVEFDQQNGQILLNIPFIAYLGNELNIPIENELESFDGDENDVNMKIIAIYKKLKIELDLNDFSANKKYEELKLAYENKSSKIDETVAIHEAKHLVCALHCEYFVDSIDINNDNNKLGGMNFFGDVDIDYEKELLIAIAPYLHEIISFRDVVEKQNLQPNKDFEEIIESVEILANGDDTKKDEIFRSQYYEAQFLLKKYQKKIEQFKSLLMKYKILDHEEIMQQWESDELIEINREQNEVKFAKNNFFVKRVKLITYCPELIEQGIYKDVKHIFKTDFIENFLSQSPNHPINQTIDKKIAWGFAADFTQQEAVIKAKNSDNIIIQGPPGTGKTQTILNIIIDALFHNKKILICAEKITALKVIEDRIKTKAPILNNFIFNIFSDTGNISFFQELAKKMINITKDVITHSTTSFLYNYENEIQKIQLIKNLATKLINLDLPKLYSDQKKWKDEFIKMGINRQNIDELLKSVVTKDLNELLKREGELETIENWKKQLDLCKKFHDDHFDCNFPKDEIKKIHELNNSWTYNEQNRWRYALYYYTKKSNVNFFLRFFIKKKYDEKAKKLNFDKLFLTNVYQEFTNYCNFDDKKYTDRDLIICQDIKKFMNKIWQLKI